MGCHVLKYFCCKYDLKTGIIWIVGVRSFLWVTAAVATYIFTPGLGGHQKWSSAAKEVPGSTLVGTAVVNVVNEFSEEFEYVGSVILIVLLMLGFVTEVLLLLGTIFRKTPLLILWMTASALILVASCGAFLADVASPGPPSGYSLAGVVAVVFQLYSSWLVYSVIKELQVSPGEVITDGPYVVANNSQHPLQQQQYPLQQQQQLQQQHPPQQPPVQQQHVVPAVSPPQPSCQDAPPPYNPGYEPTAPPPT